MKPYPEPIVGAFIFNNKNQLLLVRSHKWKNNLWHVSGGHIEMGETIKQAVLREVSEEVGLAVEFIEVFDIYEAIFPSNFSRRKHFIFFECRCYASNDKYKIDNDEINEARWFDKKELSKINLEEYTKKALKSLTSQKM